MPCNKLIRYQSYKLAECVGDTETTSLLQAMVQRRREKEQKQKHINGKENILLNGCTRIGVPNYVQKSSGPNEHTLADFWRAVWEQNSHVIVMLTKVFDFIRRTLHLVRWFSKGSALTRLWRRFVEWAQNEITAVPDFHKRILFTYEAHFWLNGYVNKQNCRIWSKANPQVYVETPLHPEKLTVWCALWAGGILLQKR
ncbi:uncharacterized protein TNCV_4275121 [Trichonephila clavipes]|nr:uncharacterized protein TNCV_4275121 [Trichonephila clavipes]